jgi:predicted phosphate transport protein (TIGR00153 family)
VFWRKQSKIRQLVLEHLDLVETTIECYHQSLIAYLSEDTVERADALALETHKAEGRADDARRRVESHLLSGSLLPVSRRDILQLIEQVDRLANAAEATVDYLSVQHIRIPPDLQSDLIEIASKSRDTFAEVKAAVTSLFDNMSEAMEHTRAIEHLEGEIDHLERVAGRKLFKLEIDLAWKLQVYGLIKELVDLSDRAEDLSDLIELLVAQRRF